MAAHRFAHIILQFLQVFPLGCYAARIRGPLPGRRVPATGFIPLDLQGDIVHVCPDCGLLTEDHYVEPEVEV